MATRKTATIYVDSRYAFGVCHAFGTIRKSCEPLTSVGIPVTNRHIIGAPLQAMHFLSKIAILNCSSQTKADNLGNDRADKAGKYAAPNEPPCLFSIQVLNLPLSLTDIINYQENPSQSEKDKWIQKGAMQLSDGLYIGPNGLPVAPFLLTC